MEKEDKDLSVTADYKLFTFLFSDFERTFNHLFGEIRLSSFTKILSQIRLRVDGVKFRVEN